MCLKASWQSKLQWSQELQEYQYVILKDVPRTSKHHCYFKQPATEQAVYNILMTVVEHDIQLGKESVCARSNINATALHALASPQVMCRA